jgi:GR25 family glycosyltransferase involved in LPS biosynthesis
MNLEEAFEIDKVFCLNLARRPDRWLPVSRKIKANGFMSVERFDAIDGHTLKGSDLSKLSVRAIYELTEPRHVHEALGSLGAVGCYLSWMSILQTIVENGYKRVIVFEDDIIFVHNFVNKILFYYRELPKDCDMWMFGYYNRDDFPAANTTHVICKGKYWGNFGCMITLDGAKKILKTALPIEMHFDSYVARLASICPNVKIYFTKESLVTCDKNLWSDISTPIIVQSLKESRPGHSTSAPYFSVSSLFSYFSDFFRCKLV